MILQWTLKPHRRPFIHGAALKLTTPGGVVTAKTELVSLLWWRPVKGDNDQVLLRFLPAWLCYNEAHGVAVLCPFVRGLARVTGCVAFGLLLGPKREKKLPRSFASVAVFLLSVVRRTPKSTYSLFRRSIARDVTGQFHCLSARRIPTLVRNACAPCISAFLCLVHV